MLQLATIWLPNTGAARPAPPPPMVAEMVAAWNTDRGSYFANQLNNFKDNFKLMFFSYRNQQHIALEAQGSVYS